MHCDYHRPDFWVRLTYLLCVKDPARVEVMQELTLVKFSLFPRSMGEENCTHIHLAQTQIIGNLKIVTSDNDAFNQNGKPFTPPSPLPSAYC